MYFCLSTNFHSIYSPAGPSVFARTPEFGTNVGVRGILSEAVSVAVSVAVSKAVVEDLSSQVITIICSSKNHII
jgi:hypothetical protein